MGGSHARSFVAGLSRIALFFASFLILSACEEDASQKNSNKNIPKKHVFSGTVREIRGDAWFRPFDGETSTLKVGQKLFEKTHLIAGVASSVVLSVSDGSAIKMDGKTDVDFDAMVVETLKQTVSVVLRHGKILFDVQKKAVKEEFEIRTENASFVVHGSAGFVESTDGLEIASLKDGRMDMMKKNSTQSIKYGETLLSNASGVKILPLASSGTLILARAIDSMATEAASELGIHASKLSLEKLKAMLLKFDSAYKKKADSLMMLTQGAFKPKALNEYIGKPNVTLEALFVPGSIVMVQGLYDTIPADSLYKRTFEWEDSTAFGPKRFIANCGNGEVEYICHTWNMNFVSAKMAEVLTKANERKALTVMDSIQQPQTLKPSVVIEGSGRERIHVLPEERDIPATLRFSIAGLMGADLKQVKKITIKRKGAVIKTFNGDDLTTNSFRLPIRLKQNRVAHFEVIVTFVDDQKIMAGKVYETYCYFENYEGGKKSNRVNDMSAEEEYKNVVSKHLLKDE